MRAELLQTHTAALFDLAVERAAAELAAGQVVALPTETVYGLAANAWSAEAVARIFKIKGRPQHNPVIVHVVGEEMARRCARGWPKMAELLAGAFWPGPLTLVVERSLQVPDVVTARGDTVGVRWPSHPFIEAVIRRCGFPLAAPSANLFMEVSPTQAAHVQRSLDGRIGLIVDGGQCQVGIESTVLDLVARPPRVLRPGMIGRDRLEAVLKTEVSGESVAGALRSPGQLPRHYAPQARLVVWQWKDDEDLTRQLELAGAKMERTHVVAHTRMPRGKFGRVRLVPCDAEVFGRALYAELHECDEAGAQIIVVERPPDQPEWEGVADRLRRASYSGASGKMV